MNKPWRPAILMCIVVSVLLALFYMPRFEIGEKLFRRINILSDIQCRDSSGNILAEIEADHREGIKTSDEIAAELVVVKPEVKDTFPPGMVTIEDFSEGDTLMMDKFFAKLKNAKKRVVRIAYFGDSFVAGDLMTQDLRELFQSHYGGYGPGWIEMGGKGAGYRVSVKASMENFEPHAVTYTKVFKSELQGVNGRYYDILPEKTATFHAQCQSELPHASHADRATIYFAPGSGVSIMAGINGGKMTQLCKMGEASGNSLQTRTMKGNIKSFNFSANGGQLPTRFFGVALDSETGVVLDNFGCVANPGFNLNGIPDDMLQEFARQRPYDLIIWHYGLNIANGRLAGYDNYVKMHTGIINRLRKAYPGAAIVLSSLSDEDTRDAHGEFVSCPGVKELVAVQRKMASDLKIAFWSLYDAMGGSGSLARMTAEGTGERDYCHINNKGGKVIAKLIFDVYKAHMDNYLRKHSDN